MDKKIYLSSVKEYIKLVSFYLKNCEDRSIVIDENKFQLFLKLSDRHSLKAIYLKALGMVSVGFDERLLAVLDNYYILNITKVVSFNKERADLFHFLNQNKIDFLPLKGIILKDYYPEPYVREFADNDILFDGSKSKIVRDFFIKKKYEIREFNKSNHDAYVKKPFYNFEMHRTLFSCTDRNKKINIYFKDYLNKAPIKENYEHESSKEDFYIYFTAHAYDHFRDAGCGLRTLIDYYLYLKNNELDFDYINKELEKIDLLEFSNQIKTLSIKLFDNEPLDEKEEEMLLFIASSGTYGTLEHSVAKGIKEKGKFGYFMSRVFPPYSSYKHLYPWAYYTIILIPVAWLFRLFRIIIKNHKKVNIELKIINKKKE